MITINKETLLERAKREVKENKGKKPVVKTMKLSPSLNLQFVLKDLYDSEINFELSTFWDGGYTLKIFGVSGSFQRTTEGLTLKEVPIEIVRMVVMHYPDSDFAKRYRREDTPKNNNKDIGKILPIDKLTI